MKVDVKIEEVAKALGLKVATVRDLLDSGWVYSHEINKARRWEGPEASYTNITSKK